MTPLNQATGWQQSQSTTEPVSLRCCSVSAVGALGYVYHRLEPNTRPSLTLHSRHFVSVTDNKLKTDCVNNNIYCMKGVVLI